METETYSKEQLIEAQTKYNLEYMSNPDKFTYKVDSAGERAKLQVEYLITLMEK